MDKKKARRRERKKKLFDQSQELQNNFILPNNINIMFVFSFLNSKTIQPLIQNYENAKYDLSYYSEKIITAIDLSIANESQYRQNIQKLQSYLLNTKNQIKQIKLFAGLKLAMLMHYILLYEDELPKQKLRNKGKLLNIANYVIKNLYQALSQKNINEDKQYLFVKESVMVNYLNYLQKRVQQAQINLGQLKEKKHQIEKQAQLTQNLNEDLFKDRLASHYENCYKCINLLNKGLKISKKFITILRYYSADYSSLKDFNGILAKDFSEIYKIISNHHSAIKRMQKEFQAESTEYFQLNKQIECIHEGMYPIILNFFNIQVTKKYLPTWIVTTASNQKTKLKKIINPEIQSQRMSQQELQDCNLKSLSSMKSISSATQCEENQNNSYSLRNQGVEKYQQNLDLLKQLQDSFKKKFSSDEKIIKFEAKKKNRSFFQSKKVKNKGL